MEVALARGSGDVGVIEIADALPLMKRKRLARVEQVHIIPPYDSDGMQTSIGVLFLTKLTAHALNLENSLLFSVLCETSSWICWDALTAAFTNNKFRGPGPKLEEFDKSIMKVGLSSASIRSMTLSPWRSRNSGDSCRLSPLLEETLSDITLPGVLILL